MLASDLEGAVQEHVNYRVLALKFLNEYCGVSKIRMDGDMVYVGYGFNAQGELNSKGRDYAVMETAKVEQVIAATAEAIKVENEAFRELHAKYKQYSQWEIREDILREMSTLTLEYLSPRNQWHYETIRQFVKHKGLLDRRDSQIREEEMDFIDNLASVRERTKLKPVEKEHIIPSLDELAESVRTFAERFSFYRFASHRNRSLDSDFDYTPGTFYKALASIDHGIMQIARKLGLHYDPVSVGLEAQALGYAMLYGFKKRHGEGWEQEFIRIYGQETFDRYFNILGESQRAELNQNRLRKPPVLKRLVRAFQKLPA